MNDTCPQCGAEMLDKVGLGDGRHWIESCGKCDYSAVFLLQPDGTIIAKGHMPNQPESPDSCEGGEMSDEATCKDGLQVESDAAPFTKEERAHIMRDIADRRVLFAPLAKQRYEATLRAVEAERDAYREVCRWWFCGCTQEEARAKFEDWAAIHGLEFKAQWCKAFDTLKALEEARAQR